MLEKGTKSYSILHLKCPYCQEGDFFVSHPYDLRRAGDTYERCQLCHRKFSIEPGFYYGAMYVSYGMGVAVAVGIWVAFLVVAPETPSFWQVFTIAVVMLGTGPLLYALSKIIWANMFFDYQGPPPVSEEP
jgi:hypothetical protein